MLADSDAQGAVTRLLREAAPGREGALDEVFPVVYDEFNRLARTVRLRNALAVDARAEEVLALDAALDRLAALDGRRARVVEMRFFGGMEVEEVAAALGVSDRTVKRDWRKARAFLQTELADA